MMNTVSAGISLLRAASLFEGLEESTLASIDRAARRRRIEAHSVLFRQDDKADTLYLVTSGRIRVSVVTPEGEEVLLRFIEPGQSLGLMTAVEGSLYPATAEAARSSSVLSWSRTQVDTLMDDYPRLARNAMGLMVRRIDELQRRCVELTTERVEQRVARALLRLVGQAGKRTDEGVLLDMPLSRQDLAALTGTTLFTVSRLLARWQTDGLVTIGRKRIVLRRPHDLVARADGLP